MNVVCCIAPSGPRPDRRSDMWGDRPSVIQCSTIGFWPTKPTCWGIRSFHVAGRQRSNSTRACGPSEFVSRIRGQTAGGIGAIAALSSYRASSGTLQLEKRTMLSVSALIGPIPAATTDTC